MKHQPKKIMTNQKAVILFIHGILESPDQFEVYEDFATKHGYDISNVLLPGHGGSGVAFAKSSKQLWLRHVQDELNCLQKSYEKIIIVGHSMGTLLAFISAATNPDKISGIFAIASPLKIRLTPRGLLSAVKVAFKQINPNDKYTVAMKESFSIETPSVLTYATWVPRYIDLFLLIRDAKCHLRRLNINLFIVHCDKDEFVALKTLTVFETLVNSCHLNIIRLKKSGHFFYSEDEFPSLLAFFESFIMQK